MSQCREPSHYPQPVSPGELDAHLHAAGRVQLVDGAPVVVDASACTRKLYRTICVDPPWRYTLRRHDPTHRGRCQYDDMSEADLAELPMSTWAEPDAHLYLWTTNNHLAEAHRLVDAWGFTQKTVLTWVKGQIGVGHYFRNNTEHVIFAVRGSLPTLRKNQPTAFSAPRGKHSEKPQAFYDMVETMSPGPYLDVFARKQRMGWDVAGNEVYSAIPELAYKPPHEADTAPPRTGDAQGGTA